MGLGGGGAPGAGDRGRGGPPGGGSPGGVRPLRSRARLVPRQRAPGDLAGPRGPGGGGPAAGREPEERARPGPGGPRALLRGALRRGPRAPEGTRGQERLCRPGGRHGRGDQGLSLPPQQALRGLLGPPQGRTPGRGGPGGPGGRPGGARPGARLRAPGAGAPGDLPHGGRLHRGVDPDPQGGGDLGDHRLVQVRPADDHQPPGDPVGLPVARHREPRVRAPRRVPPHRGDGPHLDPRGGGQVPGGGVAGGGRGARAGEPGAPGPAAEGGHPHPPGGHEPLGGQAPHRRRHRGGLRPGRHHDGLS